VRIIVPLQGRKTLFVSLCFRWSMQATGPGLPCHSPCCLESPTLPAGKLPSLSSISSCYCLSIVTVITWIWPLSL
jgi:hypothetical protein